MINAVGLANPGVAAVRAEHLPWLASSLPDVRKLPLPEIHEILPEHGVQKDERIDKGRVKMLEAKVPQIGLIRRKPASIAEPRALQQVR